MENSSEFSYALDQLSDLDQEIIIYPVRHHSPTAAWFVQQLIRKIKPRAVLIEGPCDYNDQLEHLDRRHQLPIALYSFVRWRDESPAGCFYPFCDHSPEWQALKTAKKLKIPRRFIDLPWSDLIQPAHDPAPSTPAAHRYADADFFQAEYVKQLCRQLHVDDFDGLWDILFESDFSLDIAGYLRRCHHFCGHTRALAGPSSLEDRRREAYMADQILQAAQEDLLPLVVVVGGFHALALWARLHQSSWTDFTHPKKVELRRLEKDEHRGISLTPYSYQQLDGLTGYNAGMPSPGFYDDVWNSWQREKSREPLDPGLLIDQLARAVRSQGQPVSTADVIAVRTTSTALAQMRGRSSAWRLDILDGVIAALAKDELHPDQSPMMAGLFSVLRGQRQGRLAKGTPAPPLTRDVQFQAQRLEIVIDQTRREMKLHLMKAHDQDVSAFFHRLALLQVPGVELARQPDWLNHPPTKPMETWQWRWKPRWDGKLIESARYGPSLAQAASAFLAEQAQSYNLNARFCARLLVKSAQAQLLQASDQLWKIMHGLLEDEHQFLNLTHTMKHLLFLTRFENGLQTKSSNQVVDLLGRCVDRTLVRLENLGQPNDSPSELVEAMRHLQQGLVFFLFHEEPSVSFSRSASDVLDFFQRVGQDVKQLPVIRGSAQGLGWTLAHRQSHQAEHAPPMLEQPADPGDWADFLEGLFALARELVTRHPALVMALDHQLLELPDDAFQLALPGLRRAFMYFSPREKKQFADTLLSDEPTSDGLAQQISDADRARGSALNALLEQTLEKYGLVSNTIGDQH